ncbi:MAG: hypothetical protein IJX77_08180 [Ruminococcus sp.]|nr:hypothetical protein [Ruminococcus sp.]
MLLIKISAAVLVTVFCLTETDMVKTAVYDSVMKCLTVVIPSLYGMMILSGFLVKSGIIGRFPRILTKPGKAIFGMDGSIFPIFLFSLFAGYPVGAKMLSAEAEQGHVSRHDAELLSGVCFGAGPAFIFGCISSQLYGSHTAGRIILVSTIAANLLIALVLSFRLRRNAAPPLKKEKLNISADVLTESILSGGRSMADICIMIAAFSVLTAFLSSTGVLGYVAELISTLSGFSSETAEGLLYAFLDVTAVNKLPENNYKLLPAVCGLASFGGVCVIMQIAALASGKLSVRPLIFLRLTAAVISGFICRLIMPFMLSDETVAASELSFSLHQADSPVPSFLLIIMTVILFGEYEKLGKNE